MAFYPFADGAALHKPGTHRLFVLNASSAVLWCLLEEHDEGEVLVTAYAEHFHISRELAEVDVQKGLEQLSALGLLVDDCHSSDDSEMLEPAGLPPVVTPLCVLPPEAVCRSFRIGNSAWRLACSNPRLAEDWLNPFEHLLDEKKPAGCLFEIIEAGNGWMISCNGTPCCDRLAPAQVMPWLQMLLFEQLCAERDHRLLLHAAVLVRNDWALLLPAEAGSGKSTLTLALAAHGWQVYSDELAPVDPLTLRVDPFPLPVGIKSRSLEPLARWYPQLEQLPGHQRVDGQTVRFLGGDSLALASGNAAPVVIDTLVFPSYNQDATTVLERLEPLAALELLARTGSSQRPLEEADIKALLILAEQRDCCRLVFSDLSEAISCLEAMSNA